MTESRKAASPDMIDDVIAGLEFYRALGVDRVPVTLRPDRRPGISQTVPEFSGSGAEKMETETASCCSVTVEIDPVTEIRPGRRSPEDKAGLLRELRDAIGDCRLCKLSEKRTTIVFGYGNPDAALMFIGEAPGEDEDIQGVPFVGKAGILLTRMIEKMELSRESVYIANVIKCRPPGNREPEEGELETCRGFIERQIDIIRPKVIMTLGRIALQALMSTRDIKITQARGKFLEYRGIPVMPTFHPAYLLRNPADKWKTWSDAQKALERMNVIRT
ncbi:MAG: uracil-DNA glycosylase [Thermodesulfovibrionales bacterium]